LKFVISDPSTGKSVQVEADGDPLYGKKIGDVFDGSVVGVPGTVLKITGGTDRDGFPMRPDLEGTARKKLLVSGGPGYRPRRKGVRKRKSLRGNTISPDISQVNCVVVKGDVSSLFSKKEESSDEGES